MGQIQGSLQMVEIDMNGSGTFYSLVCLATSSVNTSVDTSTTQTNCGVLTSTGAPSMSIDFDAVCEVSPSGDQISYSDLLQAMVNKTLITARVQNPAVPGSSIGTTYFHEFDGYVTALTLSQSTTEFIKFNGTISSTGTISI